MTTIRFAGKEYSPLFPDEFEPLTPAERQLLRDSIAGSRRVCQSITVTPENGVVDGLNRLAIAAELDLPAEAVPITVESFADTEAARVRCVELNEARRHLSPEQQQKRREARDRRIAEKKAQGMSTRAIAEEEGVSYATVSRTTETPGVTPVTPGVIDSQSEEPKVTGLDGKKYTARKLSAEERKERDAQIVQMWNRNKSTKFIAEYLGVSESTVNNVVNQAKKDGKVSNRRKPRSTSRRVAQEAAEELSKMESAQQAARERREKNDIRKAEERERLVGVLRQVHAVCAQHTALKEVASIMSFIKRMADKRAILLQP